GRASRGFSGSDSTGVDSVAAATVASDRAGAVGRALVVAGCARTSTGTSLEGIFLIWCVMAVALEATMTEPTNNFATTDMPPSFDNGVPAAAPEPTVALVAPAAIAGGAVDMAAAVTTPSDARRAAFFPGDGWSSSAARNAAPSASCWSRKREGSLTGCR